MAIDNDTKNTCDKIVSDEVNWDNPGLCKQ